MAIRIGNRRITAAFDEVTGRWLSLGYVGEESSVIRQEALPFDLTIDGHPLYSARRLDRWHRAAGVSESEDGTAVTFVFEEQGLRIAHTVEVLAEYPLLRQKVQVTCLDSRDLRLLTEIVYYVPQLKLGDPHECLVHLPGQRVPIGTPYFEMARQRSVELETAPCHTSGIAVVEDQVDHHIVSTWLYSDQIVVFPLIKGQCDSISLEYRHQATVWLKPGTTITSEWFSILLTDSGLDEHLTLFRDLAYSDRLVSPSDTPEWFANARLFQIAPYPITDWTSKLPKIRGMGFNLVYLCPVQTGNWYQIHEHYGIAEQVGTETELREFVNEAHRLGLRVILDYLPQGIGVNSPFIEKHPDWLVRDALGRTHASHGWGPAAGVPFDEAGRGTLSLDWGNPDYQEFCVDWAMWYVKTFDIDGFRCDAMAWKEPNLALDNPRPAWKTIYGGIRILERLRDELKQYKPEAALLSEVWGPIFQGATDGSYENGWILHELNESWLDLSKEPLFTAAEYMQYLIYTEAARPEGYPRANYTANHDLQPVAHMARSSPLGAAVSFLHAFAKGIPFVMWLEPAGREAFFSGLMHHRSALEGYTCSYTEARTDCEDVFLSLWHKPDSPTCLAVCSLTVSPVAAHVILPDGKLEPSIRFGSEGSAVSLAADGVAVDLAGGGYALLDLGADLGLASASRH